MSDVCGHPHCDRPVTVTDQGVEHVWQGRPAGTQGLVLGPAGSIIGHQATPSTFRETGPIRQ